MKNNICPFCKGKLDKGWVKDGSGKEKLVYWCCFKTEYKRKDNKFNFSLHRYKDAVAFGVDKKTGKAVAVDKKGNFFDPRDTHYAQHPFDNHGWKTTGKIKPKKTYHI